MEYVESQKVSVEFRMDSVPSQIESERAGHPVFVEKPFVTVVIPGSGNTIIDTIADEIYQKRFPEQWARFKAGLSGASVTGWRLESWPAVNTAQVKTLQYMGVHTVEQLADMSDSTCQSLGMGTMELRVKAKAALSAAKGGADVERLAAENARRDEEMKTLKAQLAELREAKEEAPRRGPGRPPKE
jgi:hypothetical protein